MGQYMADAAEILAAKGYDVEVLSANRDYETGTETFPSREILNGVRVRRLPFSSLGKKTILHRLIGQIAFCVQAFLRGLFTPKLEVLLVTTSPPMGGAVGWVLSLLRRCRLVYWVMDINPDQTVALGKVSARHPVVGLFDWFNRRVLRRADAVVVLDRFMGQTLEKKTPLTDRLSVIPPWPLENHLEEVTHADNPFRQQHDLQDKLVVMYSGNHSLAHPLGTILEASRILREDKRILFAFIGGGLAKQEVEATMAEADCDNILSLPYQPLDQLRYSLSAADIHLVVMGNEMVGLVHPCKVYGAMAVARPLLYVGPAASHIGEMITEHDIGWQVEHGEAIKLVEALKAFADLPPAQRQKLGEHNLNVMKTHYAKAVLAEQFTLEVGAPEPRR